MKTEILSLRVSRRAIGAAILQPDRLVLSDGRHLPSAPTRAIEAATRYLERMLRTSLTVVIVDAPRRGVSTTTDAVLNAISQLLASRGLTPVVIGKGDVLAAYGVSALRTRSEVREVVAEYWPELGNVRGQVKPYAVDAAAAALYGECRVALSLPSP